MNDIKITYIFHNCFVLDVDGFSLVFDIPAKRFRKKKTEAVLKNCLHGKQIICFSSHSHLDHFAPDLLDLLDKEKSVTIVSDDIADMFPEIEAHVDLVVEPDEEYEICGFKIITFTSNDLGVAFHITTPSGVKIYHGGDLACWDWEELKELGQRSTRKFYSESLQKIKSYGVDIGFSNVEQRLNSLGGIKEFYDVVGPDLLIPMHYLGRSSRGQNLPDLLGIDPECVFIYSESGKTFIYDKKKAP